jgi:manganese transport protein
VLIPLVTLTSRRAIMGALVNRRVTIVAAIVVTAAVIGLNGVLLWLAVTA